MYEKILKFVKTTLEMRLLDFECKHELKTPCFCSKEP